MDIDVHSMDEMVVSLGATIALAMFTYIARQIYVALKVIPTTKRERDYATEELLKLIADGRLTVKRKNEDLFEEEKPKRYYELGDDGELQEVIDTDH